MWVRVEHFEGEKIGSGHLTKVVKNHTCKKPDGSMGGKLAYGSEWRCDCGKAYRLGASGRGGPDYVWEKQ